jgi:hypothetical protein
VVLGEEPAHYRGLRGDGSRHQPGEHGKPVLAPLFVEWLMGLSIGSAP